MPAPSMMTDPVRMWRSTPARDGVASCVPVRVVPEPELRLLRLTHVILRGGVMMATSSRVFGALPRDWAPISATLGPTLMRAVRPATLANIFIANRLCDVTSSTALAL